jgi:hypothetical protein
MTERGLFRTVRGARGHSGYRRYQQLLAAERDLLHAQLQQASAEVSARAAELTEEEITALIEEAREAVHREGTAS